MRLTHKQERFVFEYLIDLNATQAAVRAGYKEKAAYAAGSENLRKPQVAAAIQLAREQVAEKASIDTVKVLKQLEDIATCDINEIVQVRRECCRFCYGKDNRYQFTRSEFERHLEEHRRRCADAESKGEAVPDLDEKGGCGFDPRRDPSDDCPECFGRGCASVWVADTRKLSKRAKGLIAGIKQGRNGIEIKLNSQVDALISIGRHLGMFQDKVDVTSGGQPIGAGQVVIIQLPDNGRGDRLPDSGQPIEHEAAADLLGVSNASKS